MTAAVLEQDCGGCGHPQGVHRRGLGGCAALDCGACNRYTPPTARPAPPAPAPAGVARYRTKAGHVSALRWTGDNTSEVIDWILATGDLCARWHEETDLDTAALERCPRREHIALDREHGTAYVLRGDWVVLEGREHSAVVASMFDRTYEPAAEPAAPARVLGGYDAFACTGCGARYHADDPDHPCGPLLPVTVTISAR